jgi:hypothetical protein
MERNIIVETYLNLFILIIVSFMSFNRDTLTKEEREFLEYKGRVSQEFIIKHLENGLDFHNAVITEAQESISSYHNWIHNNIKDEDKHKFEEFNKIQINYQGSDLTDYEKKIFDKLPDIGKWQCGNYSRMWRALEEADESLMEFVYNEVNYLSNPKIGTS